MSVAEIESAIRRLPPAEAYDLIEWIDKYRFELPRLPEDKRFAALIDEAYASGEPSPLTKEEIDAARRIVKDRIAARLAAK